MSNLYVLLMLMWFLTGPHPETLVNSELECRYERVLEMSPPSTRKNIYKHDQRTYIYTVLKKHMAGGDGIMDIQNRRLFERDDHDPLTDPLAVSAYAMRHTPWGKTI